MLKLSLSKLEAYWHVFALFYLSGGFFPLMRQMTRGVVDPSVGDPFLRYGLIVVYLISLSLFIIRPPKDLKLLLKPNLLWLLIGFVFLSITWAALPMLSLRRAISILFASVYGALLSLRYPPKNFFILILSVLTIEIILSYLMVILVPEWGITTDVNYGSWRGIFTAKNGLGRIASLAIIGYTIHILKLSKKYFFPFIGLIAIATTLLVFSGSATALILTIFSVGLAFILRFSKEVRRDLVPYLLILFVITMTISIIVVSNYEFLLTRIGKDITFTGRVPLWQFLLEMVQKRLLLGYGYSGFWLGWNGPSSAVWENFAWNPPHAHNGYIDLLLELGLFGTVLIVIIMSKLIFQLYSAFLFIQDEKVAKALLFHLVFGIYMIVYNFVEAMYLESEVTKALFWVYIIYLLSFFIRNQLDQMKNKNTNTLVKS